jgi:hypothetical protein
MPVQKPFLLYLRSRLNLGLSIAAGCLIVGSVLFLRPHAFVPVVVILLAYAGATFALFFSRRGAAEVVAESEEDRLTLVKKKINALAQVRERISVLRLGNEGVAKAVEYFLLESGSYLEKCRELSSYSPLANERIERTLEICQVFLGELDEGSTGRRFGVAREGEPSGDPAAGFARDIIECAEVIKQRVTEDLLGTSGKERLSIMKELEEKK